MDCSAAIAFLEQYVAGLPRAARNKWTGEWDLSQDVGLRLTRIAFGLRKSEQGTGPGGLTEADAQFLDEQASALRSPQKLTLDSSPSTDEWRLKAEAMYDSAETLEEIAGLIRSRL